MSLILHEQSRSAVWLFIQKTLAVSLLANVLLLCGCNCVIHNDETSYSSDHLASASRTEKGTLPSSIQSLVIDNQFGPITLQGVDADFGWDWSLKCQASTEAKAKEYADACTITATEEGSALRIAFSRPKGHNSNQPSIHSELRIRAPKSAKVEVKNSFGSIDISEITGPSVQARNQNGAITLRAIAGEVDASTSFAQLTISNAGPARLKNQNGPISAENIAGELTASTSFGSISVRQIKGSTTLANQNGRIDAIHIEGLIKAKTSFGQIHLENTGPANVVNANGGIEAVQIGGDLEAKTSFNRISANNIKGKVDLANQNGEITAKNVSDDIKAKTTFARMSIEGQGNVIDVQNQNGPIEISAPSGQTSRINAETSFASINLELPEKAAPLITAETTFGNIQSDFPVIMKNTMPVEKMNSDPASPKVTLKTHNGGIRISKVVLKP